MDGRLPHGPRRLMQVGLALWAVAVCLGFGALLAYSSAPGARAASPERWPEDASVPIDPAQPTLVMLAHPRCPCTRASLAELARLLGQVGDGLDCFVLFATSSSSPEAAERGDLWRAALEIPDARVLVDEEGETAARLGATTSGHVVLYHRGELVFSGGVTKARGHEGDNPGRAAIRDYVLHGSLPPEATPVFGCPLERLEQEERP